MDWRTQVIGIDESNFFGPELADVASQLADTGKQVIVAGLDTDYLGRPFSPMPELLCLAESITKMLAICMRCGNPAKHTQRLVESKDLIVVGASGMYEARCRRCFEARHPQAGNAGVRAASETSRARCVIELNHAGRSFPHRGCEPAGRDGLGWHPERRVTQCARRRSIKTSSRFSRSAAKAAIATAKPRRCRC